MNNEEHVHVALPKLYGAPAYARPPAQPVQRADRPFDPDEMPLESAQTDDERELIRQLVTQGYRETGRTDSSAGGREGASMVRGRPFGFRALTNRFRNDGNHEGP